MISICANEYSTNAVNHIVTNFKKKTEEYFFLRFNDASDPWFIAVSSVGNRRKIAQYAYSKAAKVETTWPKMRNTIIAQATIDGYVASILIGPVPVTEQSLSANPHLYLPWMFKVLKKMEQKVSVKEPVPTKHASRAYIYRNLKEASNSAILQQSIGLRS
jgi:hypothetical protein